MRSSSRSPASRATTSAATGWRGPNGPPGIAPAGGPSPEIAAADAAIARGDTLRAIETLLRGRESHGLDVELHSRLAAICLPREGSRLLGVVEAYVVTVLAPERADGWRKLAAGQIVEGQYEPAV